MTDNNLPDGVLENIVKPTTGRGGNANFPSSRAGLIKTKEDKALVKQLLTETIVAYKQPRVTSDEELAQRLSDYFDMCARTGQLPTVEEMCMTTGYSQATVWDWENGRNHGFSSATSEIIKKSKDFLKTFDAKLVVSGKLNFLVYCFRSKNYYGMVDKQEVVLTPNSPLGETPPAQLPEKYAGALPEGDES